MTRLFEDLFLFGVAIWVTTVSVRAKSWVIAAFGLVLVCAWSMFLDLDVWKLIK